MARISGIELNDNFRIDYALTRIKGIGWTMSKALLTALGFDFSKSKTTFKKCHTKRFFKCFGHLFQKMRLYQISI